MFYFNQTLGRTFLDRNIETELGTEFTFNDLATTADWWLYMDKVFLNNLHGLNYEWKEDMGEGKRDEDKIKNRNIKRFVREARASDEEESENEKEESGDGVEGSGIEGSTNNTKEEKITTISRIYLRDNILLGPPRLRQIRVQEKSCEVHEVFLTYFVNCYAGYTKNKENNTGTYMGYWINILKLKGILIS